MVETRFQTTVTRPQDHQVQTDKLALLPLAKRQRYCVGDRLKMNKQINHQLFQDGATMSANVMSAISLEW